MVVVILCEILVVVVLIGILARAMMMEMLTVSIDSIQ